MKGTGSTMRNVLRSLLLCMLLATVAVTARAGDTMYCTGNGGTALLSIDLDTGVSKVIGNFGYDGTWAAAFTPDGTLWTLPNWGYQLATVDLKTGAATVVGLTGAPEI